jgi:hypothetical protein
MRQNLPQRSPEQRAVARRFRGMRLVVIAALLLTGRTAAATVGGPTIVELLGFDAPDAKIYVVTRFEDESGRPPEVHFIHAAGPRLARVTRVESIESDLTDRDHDVLEERIVKLRKRLRPLARISDKIAVTRATTRFVRVPDFAAGTGTRPCRMVGLALTVGELTNAVELRDCHPPSTGVVTAFAVPGGDAVLVIVSSRPDDFELGYPVQRPLLLVRAP